MVRDVSTDEIIDFFTTEPLEFTPGTDYAYSNSGYVVLGAIIERLSHMSYGDFIAHEIFRPLAMDRSAYGSNEPLIRGRVAGYRRRADNNSWENATQISMTWPSAAGGLVSSLDDLLVWDEALYTDRLIPGQLLELAWQPTVLTNGTTVDYGFGWCISTCIGRSCLEHAGGIAGFSSHILRIPDEHLLVAVLMNDEDGDPSGMAHRITEAYLGSSSSAADAGRGSLGLCQAWHLSQQRS